MFGSLLFAFLAGVLSALSPCVLPILPIVFGAALTQHRFGAPALALGLALSFTLAGLALATLGAGIGLDAVRFQFAGAVIMVAIGLLLLVPAFEYRFAASTASISNWGNARLQAVEGRGLWGQFGLGLVLGLVWSPCVGPTLGAASLQAARQENLPQVALTMLSFGIGAGLQLLLIGALSRDVLKRWRGKLAIGAGVGKKVLGVILTLAGAALILGLDKSAETAILAISPDWLTDLTTRF